DHNQQLVGQGLLQQLVACAQAEKVADDGGNAHDGPQDQLYVSQFHTVDFAAGLIGNDPVGCSHEAGEHPDDQQVGVHRFGDVEGHDVQQGIGTQVLGCRKQAEDQLQAEQN